MFEAIKVAKNCPSNLRNTFQGEWEVPGDSVLTSCMTRVRHEPRAKVPLQFLCV